jgi:hypothetical protein
MKYARTGGSRLPDQSAAPAWTVRLSVPYATVVPVPVGFLLTVMSASFIPARYCTWKGCRICRLYVRGLFSSKSNSKFPQSTESLYFARNPSTLGRTEKSKLRLYCSFRDTQSRLLGDRKVPHLPAWAHNE